jgi:hypothetical protein
MEVVPECMDSAGSTTRRWRRVAGRWFNVGGGGGAPMIELGFRGGRISVDDCRGGRLGGRGDRWWLAVGAPTTGGRRVVPVGRPVRKEANEVQ